MISRPIWASVVAFVFVTVFSGTAAGEPIAGVEFPQGAVSFADRLVSVSRDNDADIPSDADCQNALGVPDGEACPLGSAGEGEVNEVVVEFVDNALVDIEGADLHVFESGTSPEAIAVAVSVDGTTWFEIGQIDGEQTAFDLADFDNVPAGEVFYFVRLRDVIDGETSPGGPDLDAVGAIGSIDIGGLADDVCAQSGSAETFGGVEFAHGPTSFADVAVLYRPADGVEGESRDPARAVGGPDGESTSLGAAANGQPGQLTVFFQDNVLVDLLGPDVVLIGSDLDGVAVEVSVDGERWLSAGSVDADGQVDLSSISNPVQNGYYRFLRLTGSGEQTSTEGPSAGADIDAIGALSSCDPVVVNDTDADGIPDELTTEPADFDADGFSDTEDTCPADPSVAQSTPLEDNQRCNWPGVDRGPGFIIEDEEGCAAAGGSPVSPWPALILFALFVGVRRGRERVRQGPRRLRM